MNSLAPPPAASFCKPCFSESAAASIARWASWAKALSRDPSFSVELTSCKEPALQKGPASQAPMKNPTPLRPDKNFQIPFEDKKNPARNKNQNEKQEPVHAY